MTKLHIWIRRRARRRQRHPYSLRLHAVERYLVTFHWWRRETFIKVGAYHLRARTGENLLFLLAADHDKSLLGKTETLRRHLDRVRIFLTQETTPDESLEALEGGDPDLSALWMLYQDWAASDNCTQQLGVLEAFIQVTVYEVNRVSKDWYPGKVKIEPEGRSDDVFNSAARREGKSGTRFNNPILIKHLRLGECPVRK
jgi:hypothetical protein